MAVSRKTIREWVAAKVGRFDPVTITVDPSDSTLFNVPRLADITADAERLVDSYLMLRDDSPTPEWRRIVAVNTTLGQVSITRAFDVTPDPATPAAIYGLLNPDEWNNAINEALTALYFPDRQAITLVADQQDYALPSWIRTRGQVRGFRYRHIASGEEQDVPRYRLTEDLTGVTVRLHDKPWDPSQYELILEASRWHDRLDADDWGTTCPQPLWQSAVEVAVYHKIFKKYGERFKRAFMQDLVIAERELLTQRAAILPRIQQQEYYDADDFVGPDIDLFFQRSSWA